MKIVALETSGLEGSVAVLDGERLVAELCLDGTPRTAQALTPAIHDLLTQAGWKPRDVELVAVASGPGSFTGLRLGVTTAKVFAYVTGCALRAVNTLDAIAHAAPCNSSRIHAVIDAQRGDVFCAVYQKPPVAEDDPPGDPGGLPRLFVEADTRLLDEDRWLKILLQRDCVTGPGLENLREKTPPDIVVAPQSLWRPQARIVGLLALRDALRGVPADDPWTFVPRYDRRSAAEEKRDGDQTAL